MFSFFSRGRQWASSFANEGRRKGRPLRLGSAARDAPECPEFGAISHDALRICSALEIIILYKRKKCNSFSQYCCDLWRETDFSCKISIKGRNLSAKSLAEFAPAGANKVKIIFSGGKWVRLQEHKRSAARLAKSNPCSAYVGENTSRPASWVRLQTRKLCAARLVKSNPCSAVEFLCRRRRNYARSRAQTPSNANPAKR